VDLQVKLDEEFGRLVEDRRLLRDFIFPRVSTNQPITSPSTFIAFQKPSDLEPAYIVDKVDELGKQLVVVCGDDPLSQEAQDNATLNFRMHTCATLATRRVLEKFHLTKEAFHWVVGEIETKFNQSVADPV
ncbi:RNA polymerase Rpb1, domain 6-domain-containing protein, partial [Crepidotus variabilis]